MKRSRLVLTLLGGFDARAGSGSALAFPTKKARALLAYLAMPLGRAHPREKLAALLWGDMPDAQARGNLRKTLSRIQKAGGAAVRGLLCRADTVALDPSAVEVDAGAFELLVRDDRPGALEQAVERYRGDLLEGLTLPERTFDEWLISERERLHELAVKALGRLLAHQSATGADDQALRTARRLLELDPFDEAAHRLVMRLHWRCGRRAAALRQYDLCVGLLARELRAEPEAETRQLQRDILTSRLERSEREEPPPPIAGVAATVTPPSLSDPTEPVPPLIGREQEWAKLRALLEDACARTSRVVALVGEPGIGKSRLLAELAALATRGNVRVLWARAHETEQVLPLAPWLDALRAGGVVAADQELRGLSPAMRADLARVLPELGAEPPRADALRLNPLRVFTALAQLIASAAARRPLSILIDDFHWSDDMSVRLLAFLGRRLRGVAALLVVSVRSEELADAPLLRRTLDELSSEGHLVRTEVRALSPEDTRRLVRVAGQDVSPEVLERFAAEAWRLAEGNPFVALEAVRTWRAQEAPGRGELSLPERVRRSIVDRLERLDSRAAQLLGVAAVIGRDLDAGLLLQASGLDDREAMAGFESLMRAGILQRDGERVGFRHERVRDTAAGLLSAPRRALIHRQIAAGLEALTTSDSPHLEIARHYRAGEAWDKALTHFRAAARLTAARSAYRDAAACYAEALDVCRRAPARPDTDLARVDVQVELGSVLHTVGDVEQALEHYRGAEAGATSLGDRERVAWIVAAMSYAYTSLGQHTMAAELAHRALAEPADAAADAGRWIWLQQSLVRTAFAVGDFQAAISTARATLDVLDGRPADESFGPALLAPLVPSVAVRGFLVLALSACGQFADALAVGAETMAVAEKVNRSAELAWASYCLGRAALDQGNADDAVGYLERALALTREWQPATRAAGTGLRPLADFATATLGLAYAAMGQLVSAVSLAAAGVSAGASTAFGFAGLLEIQGSVLLAARRLDEAAAVAAAALEMARARGERGHEACALRLSGEIARRRQPAAGAPALGYFDRALALADQLEMRPLRAWCRLERAEVLYHAGRHDEAAPGLAAAVDDFRAMEMTAGLRRAEALEEALSGRYARSVSS